MPHEPSHGLLKRIGWVKLTLTVIVAIAAAVAHLPNIVINKTLASEPKVIRVGAGDLVKRDGKLSRAACEGLVKHKHAKRREILDTYGIPDDPDGFNEDFAGTGGTLVYVLRGEDNDETCTLDFDYHDKLERVAMTLWAAKPDW